MDFQLLLSVAGVAVPATTLLVNIARDRGISRMRGHRDDLWYFIDKHDKSVAVTAETLETAKLAHEFLNLGIAEKARRVAKRRAHAFGRGRTRGAIWAGIVLLGAALLYGYGAFFIPAADGTPLWADLINRGVMIGVALISIAGYIAFLIDGHRQMKATTNLLAFAKQVEGTKSMTAIDTKPPSPSPSPDAPPSVLRAVGSALAQVIPAAVTAWKARREQKSAQARTP